MATEEESKYYSMEFVEEDGRTYALFYNEKDELVGKIEVKKTVEQWLEETRSKIING